MSFRSIVRQRRGIRGARRPYLWWFTLSLEHPFEWHGPYRTEGEADKAVFDHIFGIMGESMCGRRYQPPPLDLRQAAWALWPELR